MRQTNNTWQSKALQNVDCSVKYAEADADLLIVEAAALFIVHTWDLSILRLYHADLNSNGIYLVL